MAGRGVLVSLFAYAGVEPATCDCLLRDLHQVPNAVYTRVSKDALISRSRSTAATGFLRMDKNIEVMIMIDHDISWQQGDLNRLATKVIETESLVGGVYSKRAFGHGMAVQFRDGGDYTIGSDLLVPGKYLSAGFFGIHRKVVEKLSASLPLTSENFWPFFLPMLAATGSQDERPEYLSEDWAFCERARAAGFDLHIDLKPRLVHNGRYAFRVIDGQVQPGQDRPVTVRYTPT